MYNLMVLECRRSITNVDLQVILGLLAITTILGSCFVLFASYKGVKSHYVVRFGA
jgi:glycerol-3-phosphate acyltransferase PlsY